MLNKISFLLLLVLGNIALSAPDAACDSAGEATRNLVTLESDREGMRVFAAVLAVTNQYEQVRNTHAMQEIPTETRSDLYHARLLAAFQSSPFLTTSLTVIPPALLTWIGASALIDNNRFLGGVSLGLAVVSSLSTLWLSFGGEGNLSREERVRIRNAVDTGIAEPTAYLGQVLNWSASQRNEFSEAVHRQVISTLDTQFRERQGDLGTRLVNGLKEIDFISIIAQRNLATPSQIQALRQLRELQNAAAHIRITASRDEINQRTRQDGQSPGARIAQFVQLQRLLQATENELPTGAAKTAINRVLLQTAVAVDRLRAYCELGY